MTKCKSCGAGGKSPSRLCPRCKRCLDHIGCECVTCRRCKIKNPPGAYCRRCGNCHAHHVAKVPPNRAFPMRACSFLTGKETFLANPLRRSLGLELELGELGSLATPYLPHGATLDHDGSVHPSGRELVLPPYMGDQFLIEATNAAAIITKYGAKANETCGFHVHVDVAADSISALRRIFVGFRLLQDQIFGALVLPRRALASVNGTIYSAPLATPYEELAKLLALSPREITHWFHTYLYGLDYTDLAPGRLSPSDRRAYIKSLGDDVRAKAGHKYENVARRQAINFHSWFMRGTVEWRLKEGVHTHDEILNWPLFCGWFTDRLIETNEQTLRSWLDAPPKLLDLADTWAHKHRMPSGICHWIAQKQALAQPAVGMPPLHPKEPKKRAKAPRQVMPVFNVPDGPDWDAMMQQMHVIQVQFDQRMMQPIPVEDEG